MVAVSGFAEGLARHWDGGVNAMRIAVFADVHGNLPALQAVLNDIRRQGPDLTVCLGDLAFKGPAPGECVRLLQALGIPCVHGNTDVALLHVAGHPGAPPLPPGYTVPPEEVPFLQWHLSRMAPAEIDYLAGLPFDYRAEGVQFVHASPRDCNAAIRPGMAPSVLAERLHGTTAGWVVVGHIHEPFVLREGGRLLVGAGAVGFSLDRDWRPAYVHLDTERGAVSHRRVEYDIHEAVGLAKARGFCFDPTWYEDALRKGWWEPIPWNQHALRK